jgi:hypothetical protein
MKHVIWICALFVLFCVIFIGLGLMASQPSHGHSWYDADCCNDKDCEPMEADYLPVENGQYLLPNGEKVAVNNVRPSLDGRYHWCRIRDLIRPQGKLSCLYVPSSGV